MLFIFIFLIMWFFNFVPLAEVSIVSSCIFCIMDRNICDLPMDRPCLCFDMVKPYMTVLLLLYYYYWIDLSMVHNDDTSCYRWPYPFLDLSAPYAPLWYALVLILIKKHFSNYIFEDWLIRSLSRWHKFYRYIGIGLLHIPCYGIFVLIIRIKNVLLSRSFPESFQGVRWGYRMRRKIQLIGSLGPVATIAKYKKREFVAMQEYVSVRL